MFLSQIKASTQAFHDRLERDLDVFHTVKMLEGYSKLLQKFLGFYLPVEPHLLDVQNRYNLRLDVHQRLKSPLLLRDLSDIGMHDITSHALPLCERLPELTNPAQLWGCLYVLEGSTLGGAFISKYVQKTLGLTAEHGCAFFSSYGSNVGPMWRTFTQSLEEYATRYHMEGIIIDSACETFVVLSQWLLEGVAHESVNG